MNEQSITEQQVWYEIVERDYVLRMFYRSRNNEVIVVRNGVKRQYNNVSHHRITEIGRIVRDRRIEIECEFVYYTEISFSFDGERPVQS